MSLSKRLTWPQYNALRALRDACDQLQGTDRVPARYTTPTGIARMLWPDSDGWERASNRGSTPAGGAMGATMPMKAATVLWRLRDLRCAELFQGRSNKWTITQAGRQALTDERRLPAFVIRRDGSFEYLGETHHLISVFGGGYLLAVNDGSEAVGAIAPAGIDPIYRNLYEARTNLRCALASGAPTLDAWTHDRARLARTDQP